jgi:N-acylneuraminate cytidylyltransferase
MTGGGPLIWHILNAARSARLVTRTVVSTDDDEIAAVSRAAGAEVVMRPAEISGDSAASEAAVLHVLGELERTEGYRPEIVAFLQATAPLTTAEDIDGTIEQVSVGGADSALAVTPFHYFLWRDGDEGATGINHDHRTRALRQEQAPQYLECGSVYVFRTDGFVESRHRFFGRVGLHVVEGAHRLEIDEPHDLEIANVLLRRSAGGRIAGPVAGLALDFDGVLTDNKVSTDQHGTEAVRFDRGDGLGLSMLKSTGMPIIVLSTEANPVVAARCEKLGLEYKQGLIDKREELEAWAERIGLDLERVVYVGNDANDVACLLAVGWGVAVADAHESALRAADIVLSRRGGEGAVREIADMLIEAANRSSSAND